MSARISPAEAHAKMAEGYVYVDVRTEEEFALGHPEGAFNVPVSLLTPAGLAPNDAFVSVMARLFAKDAPLVVGCKMGGRSARAAQLLGEHGFTQVLDQRAGYEGTRGTFGEITERGWAKAGLPIASGAPAGRSYADLRARADAG